MTVDSELRKIWRKDLEKLQDAIVQLGKEVLRQSITLSDLETLSEALAKSSFSAGGVTFIPNEDAKVPAGSALGPSAELTLSVSDRSGRGGCDD